jgi:hypothetical protein
MKDDERRYRPRSHRTDENVEKQWSMVHSDGHVNNIQA